MKKFQVAFEGLAVALKDKSVQIQCFFALCALVAGVVLQFNSIEWCLLFLSIGAVIAAEIFNTCIERLCDVVLPRQDERIKKIKDMASAAVLVVCFAALFVGITIVLCHIPF